MQFSENSLSDEFIENHPYLKGVILFLEKFNLESDRGAVMIAASMMDDLMRQIVIQEFKRPAEAKELTEGYNAPLGTFSARLTMCFAMDIITEEAYREAKTVQKIRNRFGHDIHIAFGDATIMSLCKNLQLSTVPVLDGSSARERFNYSAIKLILYLGQRYDTRQFALEGRPPPCVVHKHDE